MFTCLCHFMYSKSQILRKIVMDKKIDQKVCKFVSNTPNKLSFVSLNEKVEDKVFFSFSFFACTTWEIWYLMDIIIKVHEIISCMP